MPLCPQHGLEATIKDRVPNKKTGGFYPPFYGCPWKGVDETGATVWCKHRFTERPSQAAMFQKVGENKEVASSDKDKSISWLNAKNCSAQLISSMIPSDARYQALSPESLVAEMQALATMIYYLPVPPPDPNAPPF